MEDVGGEKWAVEDGPTSTSNNGEEGGGIECPKWQLIRVQPKQFTNYGDKLTHLSFLAEILFSTNVRDIGSRNCVYSRHVFIGWVRLTLSIIH